ncbi:hypothetical protein GCM10022226_61570 [Sphaerisporangium flaviroseum]|uniref:Uncharacterized protein n=1 Tax=Sphaerisporangium flaviroseum TaxID=509199 RepID=A0ABP7J180_9ACTN
MRIRSVVYVAILAGGNFLFGFSAHAAVPDRQQGAVVTDIVEYRCTTIGTAESQDIQVKVELTMPAGAKTGEQTTIGWRGTYIGTGLRAPTEGLPTGTNLYAYGSISGMPGLASATGVGRLGTVLPGQIIPLPTAEVGLKTTPSNAGTATVRPAAINIGPRPTERSIDCAVQNGAELTTYTLTIAAGGQTTGSPAPATTSPKPTRTVTETVTDPPTGGNHKVTKTPLGAAETGGGGQAGPDGRVFVVTGFLLTLAAATGLLLRRRTIPHR